MSSILNLTQTLLYDEVRNSKFEDCFHKVNKPSLSVAPTLVENVQSVEDIVRQH